LGEKGIRGEGTIAILGESWAKDFHSTRDALLKGLGAIGWRGKERPLEITKST